MLEKKIHVEYVSEEAFETLMRATVIAFMARSPWDVNMGSGWCDELIWVAGLLKWVEIIAILGYAWLCDPRTWDCGCKENMFSTQGAKQTASPLT